MVILDCWKQSHHWLGSQGHSRHEHRRIISNHLVRSPSPNCHCSCHYPSSYEPNPPSNTTDSSGRIPSEQSLIYSTVSTKKTRGNTERVIVLVLSVKPTNGKLMAYEQIYRHLTFVVFIFYRLIRS